jgi:hypothetical protein
VFRFVINRAGHDDDEDADGGAPAGSKAFDGGSSDEDNDDCPTTPHGRVAPAAGAPKPLPPPPPPKQLAAQVAKVVEWRGVGAGTVDTSRRLFALCCPCLTKTDSFEPLQ